MTNNPDNSPFLSMPEKEVIPDALTLLAAIRGDLSSAIEKELTHEDSKADVIVSSVANGVFVAAIAESKAGELRFLDLELTTVLEMWQLKQQQYDPAKGGWLSIQFTVGRDGFVEKTAYNYDKRVFSGNTPAEWFIAPETETDDYRSVWTDEQYREDLETFPRTSGSLDWLEPV